MGGHQAKRVKPRENQTNAMAKLGLRKLNGEPHPDWVGTVEGS